MSNKSDLTYHGAWEAPPIPKKPHAWEDEAQKTPAEPTRNLGQILQEFGQSTTAHGVPRIASSKRSLTKIFWLAVFLAMLLIFCWQGTDVLMEYLSHPSTTKVILVTNPVLTFPSVTICNMNRLRRSKLPGTRFDGLIHLDGGLTDDGGANDYSWWFDWDPEWYSEYMATYRQGNGTTWGGSGVPSVDTSGQVGWGPMLDTGTADATSVDSADDPTASLLTGRATLFPAMTPESSDGSTPDETPVFGATPARSTSPPTSTDDTSQTLPMTSGNVGNGFTTAGLPANSDADGTTSDLPSDISSVSLAVNSETPQATTTVDAGTVSGTQQQPGDDTTENPQSTVATGTSRRKKRSLRQIRDTGPQTSSQLNGIEDVIGEFGSWVGQEWNDGGEPDQSNFDFQYEQYFDWDGMEDENDWRAFYERSTSPDYSDFLDIVNPTRQELETLGHQAEDMILQCTFDKKLCNYTDFYRFQKKEYGNCFTFNHGQNLTVVKTTKNSGAQFGLHLTLFLEMPEYVGILSPEAGIRAAIHSHTTPPFPEDDGITASPGMATNIGLRQVYVERLAKPYNPDDCRPYKPTTYSRKDCYRHCVQGEMYKRCHCVSDILLENKTKCSYLNATQQKCKQLVDYLGEQKRLNCDCPVACNETTYTKAVSSSHWPSERYEEHLQRRLKENPDTDFAARLATSEEKTSKNLVRLRVYFEELNYQSILERPLYTFPNLLANVGGLLGLYIGVSFLTIAEFITLLFHIFKYLCRKALIKEKVTPMPKA